MFEELFGEYQHLKNGYLIVRMDRLRCQLQKSQGNSTKDLRNSPMHTKWKDEDCLKLWRHANIIYYVFGLGGMSKNGVISKSMHFFNREEAA